jgi:thiol:disulfide interchange protein DsbD
VVVATPAGSGIAFAPYSPAALGAAAASRQPVIIDFSAEWCVPCHELERVTFTDRRVTASAKRFRALKVDLTHFDAPASDSMRRQFQIAGVPTLIFLDADGREVRGARIEGFVPPEDMLRSMAQVR